ncbi:MAG: Smr/MutS family protein [Planctomycetaceae bacterium]|nr:Smr/MutS family protein [Planctomycetaceae bacterium]
MWREIAPGVREIDLHALQRREARAAVLDALDSARRAGTKRLRIIHGKGTGALRDEVRYLLAEHPAVEDYKYALPRHGGDGATEVVLRRGR